ncbi:uncharacterized protein LOC134449829 [Engraulis encrasicolus]|uniref:uncharacterized protein LOC134449829 n=1 Tax=Engraulis encrasicolus TaxID=184585 RepID=UPI002FD64A1E
MAETTMIMDETGRVYVRSLDSDSDNKEESVDGPPPEGGTAGDAHSVLESSPANKKSGNMDSKEQATVADKQIGGPSDHGLVNDLLQKGTPKKDQLFPMRSEMGEKDSRLVVRLSHGQVEAEATAEDDGQSNLLQENGKGHMTQSSIPNCEQSGTVIPMMKKDDARGKNTEICCTESMAQAVHKDACSPSVNVKSDLAERCQETLSCLENEALKQRPELLTAPEHTIAAQSLIVVKHDQTTDDSKSPSLRQHVLVEHVQNTERQQEDKQILQSGHEKNKTVPVVEVPDQLKRAETTSTHTGHQQVNDNVPLESQAHHKKDVDTKATKTEDASDVSAEKDKSINDVPNQRPESLIALEHGITGQHPTGLKLDKASRVL